MAYSPVERNIPQVLDLIIVGVEAGMGFEGSVQEVVRLYPCPLSDELKRVMRQAQEGKPLDEALRDMADRTASSELADMAQAVIQAHSMGTPLARSLRSLNHSIRQRRGQRAEEEARKAPVKIAFPLIVCFAPVLFLILLGPVVLSLGEAFSKIP